MSTRAEVLVTRPIPQAALDLLRREVEVEVPEADALVPKAELLRRVRGRRGLLTLLTETVDAEVMDAAPELRAIANMAVGHDNLDLEAATRRGILVTNTPGVLDETTADLAFALLLAGARRVLEGDRISRRGEVPPWGPMTLLGQDVYGGTLGILGMGRIGTAVARRGARGFGMRVLYHDRTRSREAEEELGAERVDLDRLLAEADFVSIHLPLTAETHHLVDAARLARMRPTACLVNTSRGPVVDEAALAEALAAGRLHAAGLDVYEDEPEVHPGLRELENVVLTPHIGSASVATRTRMATLAAENLLAALRGDRPPCLVNEEAWTARRDREGGGA